MRTLTRIPVRTSYWQRINRSSTLCPRWTHFWRALVACALILATALPLHAQIGGPAPTTNVFVTTVRSDAYPEVDAQIFVSDATGLPPTNLQNTDLTVAVDGVEVSPDDFTLTPTSNGGQSFVILLDTTTSAASWAAMITSAQNLLMALQPGDAVGLMTFGDVTQVHSTLSTDLQQTRDALARIANVAPQGTVSTVNQGILDALSLFAVGEAQEPAQAANRRSIVMLSDRAGAADNPPEGEPSTLTVSQFAQQQGVALQLYAFGNAAVAAQDLLDLAQSTGGRFTPLATAGDANAHFQTLPALLRPGYLLSLVLDLPANNGTHVLFVAGAGALPVEKPFVAMARPLEITITRPAEGTTVTGEVIVAVSATSPAAIRQMTFSLADGEVITTTNGAVGGILWDTSSLPAGEQGIVVQAIDAVGNVGQSARNVVVHLPLALQVETSSDIVQIGNTTTITAVVESAYDGVMVEAFLGRTQVGVAANPAGPAIFTVDTTGFDPGRYALVVRATNSGGYSATDNSQVLTLTPAPVQPTPAMDMYAGTLVWLNRWWFPLLLGVVGLLLLWWLIAAIRRALRKRNAAAATRALQVHPQMRILLTNSGNVRTRYRLRAQAKEGEYKFTFIHNGMALIAPAVEHVVASPAAAANGKQVATNALGAPVAAYAPKPAAPMIPASVGATAGQVAQTTAAVSEKASTVSSFAGRFLMTAGDAIPGALGDSLRRAGGTVRSAQTAAAKTQFEVADVSGDAQELASMSKQAGKAAGNVAGSASGSTSTPATPIASAPAKYQTQPAAPASGKSAFALQPAKTGSNGVVANGVATVHPKWVETPPVAPGDTIGVDLYVQPQGRAKNKRVQLRLLAVPSEAEGGQPSVDEVSILLR